MSRLREVYELVYNGELEIHDDGTIWKLNRHGVLIQLGKNAKSYINVTVMLGNCAVTVPAHQLVWYHNYGEIPFEYVVHHINEIRSDNRIENLRCVLKYDHAKQHEYKDDPLRAMKAFAKGMVRKGYNGLSS